MKKMFLVLCLLTGLLSTQISISAAEEETRAVWISYLDFTSLKNKSEAEFRANFLNIINNCKKNNINTLIVQVRAFSDAIYPSDNFPPAYYISDGNMQYDALKVMIELTHANQMKIEAWINPYRIATSAAGIQRFREKSPMASWVGTDNIITYNNGTSMILNPASDAVKKYIIQGVEEIVRKYTIDGIHFDDYFYVTGTHGNTSQQERKNHVNDLVSRTYKTIKAYNPNIKFGISPAGNLENARNAGADIDTWLSEKGYIDYLMPQIYWSNKYGVNANIKKFDEVLVQFKNLRKNSSIDLIAGLALYKVNSSQNNDIGWISSSTNLSEQYTSLKKEKYQGYALFRYDFINNSNSANEMENLKKAVNELENVYNLEIFSFNSLSSVTYYYNLLKKDTNWYLKIDTRNIPIKEYGLLTGGFSESSIYEARDTFQRYTGQIPNIQFLKYGVEYKKQIYRIRTGGFRGKENVEKIMKEIQEKTGWWMSLQHQSGDIYYIVTGGFSEEKIQEAYKTLKDMYPHWYIKSEWQNEQVIQKNPIYRLCLSEQFSEADVKKMYAALQKNTNWYISISDKNSYMYKIVTGGFRGYSNAKRQSDFIFKQYGLYNTIMQKP